MSRLFGNLESRVRHFFKGGPFRLQGLEIHASHACNLACESCSHFSNHPVGGNVPLAEAEAWMAAWSRRLQPRQFRILGGEPTLNPELGGFVLAARKFWPDAELHVTTNGFFLRDHLGLPRLLAQAAPATLRLSMHHAGADYQSRYREIEALVRSWERDWGITVERVPATDQWSRRYHGYGASLRPYAEGRPAESFNNCIIQNNCIQLRDFSLFKCGPLAYLPLVARRYPLDPQWAPYLAYRPLGPRCTDAELRRWLACEAISQCAMCPTQYEMIPPGAQPDPQVRRPAPVETRDPA